MEAFTGKCRKHLSNNQPGICSLCLRDRLLQLADTYNHNTTLFNNYTDAATATDRRFSSSTSTSSSPPTNNQKHVRHASSSDGVRSLSYVIGGGGSELRKSRSIATTMMSGKRSGSFWKKLLRVRGNGSGAVGAW